jgi:subtilisin family serine protease
MNVVRLTAKRLSALAAISTAALLAACGGGGGSQDPVVAVDPPEVSLAPVAGDITSLVVPGAELANAKIDARLNNATGPVEVWATLDTPAIAAMQSKRAAEMGLEPGELFREMKAAKIAAAASKGKPGAAAVESAALKTIRGELPAHRQKLVSQQNSFAAAMKSMGGEELGRVNVTHNAVALRIDAARLKDLAATAGVVKLRPVVHYELNLSETVPYVGGAALQASGFDGTGMRIAIIDSGIDYTHRNLGGPGTTAAYAEAAGVDANDPKSGLPNALFPNSKVIGGYDFVGDKWSGGAGSPERTEDPNPIDYWFHGTHVADIAGGASLDGTHKGMAPGATLYAVKACASVSGSCNGIALIKAMDFSVDPNGDGDFEDAADVINLSLGSNYGQPEDDLSYAVGVAVELGVVVVASAGNGGDVATIVGSPSSEPGAISVAQTQVPSAKSAFIDVVAPTSIARRITQVGEADFAPVTGPLSGDVVYVGRGCKADPALGIAADDPYLADPAGKVALIDRGACGFSTKIDRAARAGAKAVLIGLIAPGAPFPMGLTAGSSVFVPSLMITQANSTAIKGRLTAGEVVKVNFDVVSVSGSMRATSSRGPSNQYNFIKPEIGAPGASVSADVGTGSGEAPFGGTSGAAPMVSGAAAQLLQAFPNRTPLQIKAMLMNNANTQVLTDPVGAPGVLAPIARIGSGELRVDRAAKADFLAINQSQKSAALSYGFQAVATFGSFTQQLRLRNFSNEPKTVQITPDFRYADDRNSGAVSIVAPASVVIPARGGVTVPVVLTVNASKLPAWAQDARDIAAAGPTFSRNEYDGYITLNDGSKSITVPWHIMPRKAADFKITGGGSTTSPITVFNAGVASSATEVFALTGESRRAYSNEVPGRGDDLTYTDLRSVGVRLAAPDVLQFGISTFGRRSNPVYPSGYEVDIDVNRDGTPDFAVFNGLLNSTSTLSVVKILNLATGTIQAFYFIDADFYSGNMILTAPLSAMGLTENSTFDFTVLSYDNYFTGNISETIGPMTFTPAKPKFALEGGGITLNVPSGVAGQVRSTAVAGGDVASPSQLGLLFLHRGNAGDNESRALKISR